MGFVYFVQVQVDQSCVLICWMMDWRFDLFNNDSFSY